MFHSQYAVQRGSSVAPAAAVSPSPVNDEPEIAAPVDWKFKYLYDGSCSACLALVCAPLRCSNGGICYDAPLFQVSMLRNNKGSDAIAFVDITDPNYDAALHAGIDYDVCAILQSVAGCIHPNCLLTGGDDYDPRSGSPG